MKNEKRDFICYNKSNEDVYLEGTRNNMIEGKDDSLTDEQLQRGFKCAPKKDIDIWRHDKKLLPISI